jgi:hypothetical protein
MSDFYGPACGSCGSIFSNWGIGFEVKYSNSIDVPYYDCGGLFPHYKDGGGHCTCLPNENDGALPSPPWETPLRMKISTITWHAEVYETLSSDVRGIAKCAPV